MKNTEAQSPGSLHRMVRRLFETRQEAKQAKAAMRQLAEKLGRCKMHYEPGESGLECYHTNLPKERWCDTCQHNTTYTVNGIGMWICDLCRRDNTPNNDSAT